MSCDFDKHRDWNLDLSANIFNRLSLRDRLSAAKSCQQFHQAAHNPCGWKSFGVLVIRQSLRPDPQLPPSFTVGARSSESWSPECLEDFKCVQLRKLWSLIKVYPVMYLHRVEMKLVGDPSIQQLFSWSAADPTLCISTLPSVRSLQLGSSYLDRPDKPFENLEALLNQLPGLERLYVNATVYSTIHSDYMWDAVKRMSRLSELNLSGRRFPLYSFNVAHLGEWTAEQSHLVVSALFGKQLTLLNLSSMKLCDEAMIAILKTQTSVKELHFMRDVNVETCLLQLPIENKLKFEALTIHTTCADTQMSRNVAACIGHCPSLDRLTIDEWFLATPHLIVQGVRAWSRCESKADKLSIRCMHVSYEPFRFILEEEMLNICRENDLMLQRRRHVETWGHIDFSVFDKQNRRLQFYIRNHGSGSVRLALFM